MPAELLDGVKTTTLKAHYARRVLIAVVACRANRGKVVERTEAVAAAGPVTRKQVLEGARELFASMVTSGLSHLSDRAAQRLLTLPLSATAIVLPRLARLVRAIADDVQLALARHANTDTSRLFGRLTTADAPARSVLSAGDNPKNHRVLCPGFGREFIESRNAALLEKLRAK